MRLTMIAATIATLVLAGCSSEPADEAGAPGEAMSANEVAREMDQIVQAEPGEYETRVEIVDLSLPDLPAAAGEQMEQMMRSNMATASRFCLTPEEAAEGPERMVTEMAEADCTFERFDMAGGKIDAVMECRQEGGMAGRYTLDGEMTPTSSTMHMLVDASLPGAAGGGAMQMDMRVSSKRVGECS